jgi:hypothetical protein
MNFFKDLFCDKNGNASSKRLMSFVAFCVIIQAVEMNLFHGAKLDDNLLVILLTAVFGLSGAATVESMAMKKDNVSKDLKQKTTTEKVETETIKP